MSDTIRDDSCAGGRDGNQEIKAVCSVLGLDPMESWTEMVWDGANL